MNLEQQDEQFLKFQERLNKLFGKDGVVKTPLVSDDFLTFCQTGKYPDYDTEDKEYNRYIHDAKTRLRKALNEADCSGLSTIDDGYCPCDSLNIYALIELAVELSPEPSPLDELTFTETVLQEVQDVYSSDPNRVINNLPR